MNWRAFWQVLTEPEQVGEMRRLRREEAVRDALVACYDCSLAYGDPAWCDAVIPDDLWAKIAPKPNGGGVLCFNCMARRLVVRGYDGVSLRLTSGPFGYRGFSEESFRLFLNYVENLKVRAP